MIPFSLKKSYQSKTIDEATQDVMHTIRIGHLNTLISSYTLRCF